MFRDMGGAMLKQATKGKLEDPGEPQLTKNIPRRLDRAFTGEEDVDGRADYDFEVLTSQKSQISTSHFSFSWYNK